jgi:putative aldouronate transport system substrate-binding protein
MRFFILNRKNERGFNMINRKKAFLCLMSLCLVFTLVLSGCANSNSGNGGSSGNAAAPNNGNKQSTEPETAELEPVTLKWLIMGTKQKDSEMVWEEFNKRLQDYLPNTTVEFEAVPSSEFAERFGLILASGETLDLSWTGWVHNFAEEVAKGAFLPVTDLVEQYGQDLLNEVPEWVFDFTTVDGELYGIPTYKDMVDLRIGMRTHKELADKYWENEKAQKVFSAREGRKATQADYDILDEYMTKLQEAGELRMGIYPFALDRFYSGTPLVGPFHMYPEDDSYTVYLKQEMPTRKLYYENIAKWFQKGFVRKDILSNSNRRQDQGKPDGYTLWFHVNFEGQSLKESLQAGFDVEVIPMEEKWYIHAGSISSGAVIPRTAKHPERAMMLIDLLHTKKGIELNNMLVHGLEGVHYTKVSDIRIETVPDKEYGLSKFVPGNQFNVWETEADIEGFNDYMENDVHGNAVISKLIGFQPDVSAFKTEMAQLKAIEAEYQGVEYGAIDNPEQAYQEYVAKMKNAGSEKVRKELQQQVDAFLKAKGINVPGR